MNISYKTIGVYVITDITNNKIYIGASTNVKERWNNHKTALKEGKANKGLQKAYNTYGIDIFKLELLEECKEYELRDREAYYIYKLDAQNPDKGYNVANSTGNSVCFYNVHKYESGLMTMGQICKMLAMGPGAIKSMIKQELIPYKKFGNIIRFDFKEIEEWLNSKRVDNK